MPDAQIKLVPEKPSRTETVLSIFLMILSIVVFVTVAWLFHSTCGDDWFMAIFKSIGIQILSFCAMIVLASPFLMWAQAQGSLTAAKIAYAISPWSLSGSLLSEVMVVILYLVFSHGCMPSFTS
jgi:hypothetical protein